MKPSPSSSIFWVLGELMKGTVWNHQVIASFFVENLPCQSASFSPVTPIINYTDCLDQVIEIVMWNWRKKWCTWFLASRSQAYFSVAVATFDTSRPLFICTTSVDGLESSLFILSISDSLIFMRCSFLFNALVGFFCNEPMAGPFPWQRLGNDKS